MKRWQHPQSLVAIGLIAIAAVALLTRHVISSTTWLVLAVIVPSIILHELSHGVVALAFGDDTARRAGRLTLNPIKHVDPIGTVVLPAILSLANLGAFGYAKPVPIDPSRMRHPRNNAVVVSLAGPLTNLVLAGASIIALRVFRPPGTAQAVYFAAYFSGLGSLPVTDRVLYLVGLLNVTLAVFNLIPIPPLDGSAVIERLLPKAAWPAWMTLRRYAMPALLVLVLLNPGHVLAHIFGFAGREWVRVLTA